MSDVGLGATLQLEIAEALARIDQVGAQLSAAVTGVQVGLEPADATPITTSIDDAVQAADTTIPVDADTTAATTEIDSLSAVSDVLVPIDADVSAADAAISDVVTSGDAEVATITVDADTSEADAAIASTGASASDAAGGIDTLTSSVQGFNGSSLDAATLASGLTNALEGISPETKAVAGGLTAVVGIIGGFVEAGTTLIAAEQRLTIATGQFRDQVESIHVGTLNTDIKGLAEQTGSTVVPIENAASRIFTLGKTSGEAGDSIAQTSGRILALAGFLRSTNPNLGETGDIAERLTNALARGGRALQVFGLSAAAADINAEALRETGKSTAAELTQYEKAAADAKLQTDKLGGSFQSAFSEGANNPVIQIGQIKAEFTALFEEIGKPIVAPVIEILRDLVPVGEDVGRILGIAVSAVLPFADALGAVVKDASPIVSVLTDILGPLVKIGTTLDPLVLLLRATDAAFSIIAKGVDFLVEHLQHLPGPLGAVETVVGHIVGFAEDVAGKIGDVAGSVDDFLGGGSAAEDKFTAAVKDAAKSADDQAVSAIKDAAAHGELTQAQTNAALAAKDHAAALAELQPVIDGHALSIAEAAAAYKPLVDSANLGQAALGAVTSESSSAGAALTGLAADGINPTSAELGIFASQMNSANLSTQGLNNAAVVLGVSAAQLTGFLSGVSNAIASFTSKVVSGLPSVADAFKPVSASAGSAGGAMANTAQQALQAQRSIESAQHGIEIANRGVEDSAASLVKANEGVQVSVDNLAKAQQNLQDAEQALADARNPAAPKDLEQANINLERAQLNVTKATDAAGNAEQALSDARRGIGSLSVHDAEIALQEARLSAEESTIRVSDAEDALAKVRAVGTEADKNVVSAEKAVETARNGVTTATAGIITAQHQVETAHRAVADAAYAAVQAEEALQQALQKPAASGGGGGGATKQAAVTLAEFTSNLEASTVKTQRFVDDVKTIFKAGDTELAGEIAQFGIGAITVADQAAAGIRTGNKALVDSAQGAVKSQNKALSDMEQFTKTEFGPAYIATTGLIANLASEAFGKNLSIAAKMRIQLAEANGVLDVQGAAIALLAGEKGADTAIQYAKNNNIDEVTLEKGLAAAQILHDNQELPTSAGELATIASGRFHDVLGPGLSQGVQDAAAEATSSPNTDRPISDFTELGTLLTQGLIHGLVARAAVKSLNDAAAGLIHGAWGSASAAAQTGSPSKLFAELGSNLAAGLTVGLTDSADPVVAAAEKIVRDAAAKIQTTIAAQDFTFGETGLSSNVRDLLANPTVIGLGAAASAATSAAIQNQVTIAAGAIQVLFTGALPTEAEAVRVGQQVEAGLIRALADRTAQINNRVLAK